MNIPDVERIFSHMWWADEQLQATLERTASPPAEALRRHAHVLGAEMIWIDRIEGVAPMSAVWPQADVPGCRALAVRARARYETLLSGLTADALDRPLAYTNSLGRSFETPLVDILLHVALHGSYHRGQAALLLAPAVDPVTPTDYIGFVRGVPAAPRGSH